MLKDSETRQAQIEKMRLEGKINAIVYDALFVCDIENDKIPSKLRKELKTTVEHVTLNEETKIYKKTKPITDKLSITSETIEKLHEYVMGIIKDRLNALGVMDTNIELLNDIIYKIIRHEKLHRDEEVNKI